MYSKNKVTFNNHVHIPFLCTKESNGPELWNKQINIRTIESLVLFCGHIEDKMPSAFIRRKKIFKTELLFKPLIQWFKVITSVLAPSLTSFMLMAFLPLSLPFFLFFFLKIHFLQMQKQHANTRIMATKAMETIAHDGTANKKKQDRAFYATLMELRIPKSQILMC